MGVAEIARDKAYRKYADKLCWLEHKTPLSLMTDRDITRRYQQKMRRNQRRHTRQRNVSDAFFPFRDGIDIGLDEGVTAVIQPGGSMRDYECIEACNEKNAAMVFTGQRSFKH